MTLTKQLLAAALLSLLLATSGHAIMISGGFTGNWYNPEASGQGFQLQVLPDGRAVAFWFTYDANGNQVWLTGENTIQGNTVELQMSQPVGASFGPGFDPDDVQLIPFGTVTLTFDDCSSGSATWQSDNPDFGSGQMPLQRLSSSAGVNCTGSAADNNSGSTPVQDFRVSLLNEGVYPLGSGHADYESRPGRIDFEVEIEDVPVGDYTLMVDGVDRGSITVINTDDGTEGEVEYSSPQDGDDRLLDFEALGALIEVTEAGAVLFSTVLEPTGDDGGNDDGDDDTPPFGSTETEVDLINTGLDPDASGDAELEQRSDRIEFEVEIEDLDIGIYELWVGGELQGEIEVVEFDDGTEGEIEFRNPVEAGKELLDFDPIGQWISIEQGGSVFLEVQFPTEPGTGDDDDDDGNDDGGSDDDDDAGGDDDEDDDDDDDDDDDEEDDEDDDDDDDEDEEDDEDD